MSNNCCTLHCCIVMVVKICVLLPFFFGFCVLCVFCGQIKSYSSVRNLCTTWIKFIILYKSEITPNSKLWVTETKKSVTGWRYGSLSKTLPVNALLNNNSWSMTRIVSTVIGEAHWTFCWSLVVGCVKVFFKNKTVWSFKIL